MQFLNQGTVASIALKCTKQRTVTEATYFLTCVEYSDQESAWNEIYFIATYNLETCIKVIFNNSYRGS